MTKAKDANAQLQEWVKKGVAPAEQARQAEGWLRAARPFVFCRAEEIGGIENVSEKNDALGAFFKGEVLALSEQDRAGFKDELCDELGITKTQWAERLKALNGNGKKKKDEEDESEPIFTAGGWINHYLVELFYKPDERRTYLAMRKPDGEITDLQERLMIGDQKYLPMPPNSTITKRTVRLPSEIGEEKSEDELLEMTKKHINRYFDFGGNDFFEEISPLYVPFSYIYDAFMEVSYLRGLGDYGTGKTRFLKSIGMICYRPIYMSGGSSAASIYSLLDMFRGTLILNEADFNQSDEASIIAKILNGGTERDEAVTKMRGTMENMTVESFNVFGPKVIATRKDFNDYAIRSRCLTMEMLPMQPSPRIPQSLPPEKEGQDLLLRNLWTRFRLKTAQENIHVDESQIDRSLEPRLNQITLSLLSTIKSEATKAKIQEFLKAYNERMRGDRYEMFTARVLEGIVFAWAWGPVSARPEDTNRIYIKDIAMGTNMIMDHQKALLGEDGDEEEEEKKPGLDQKRVIKTKSRKVSDVFSKFLNIKTLRATDGLPEYKGTKYVDMGAELDRIKALCQRWGVEWREQASLHETAEVPEDERWMKKPKFVTIDFNKTPDGFKIEREKWQNAGLSDKSEAE